MPVWCVVLVTVLYTGTAVAYVLKRDLAWALVWAAYALANVGLIAVMLRGQP